MTLAPADRTTKGRGLNSIPVRFALMAGGLTGVGAFAADFALHGAERMEPFTLAQIALAPAGLSALITYLAANRLAGAIRALRASTDAIVAGEFDTPVDVDCACEVGGLADSFRAMQQRLNGNLLRMNLVAYTDVVTGLPNRAVVSHVLGLINDKRGVASCRGALLFIDLDGFKRVNDTLGHEAGDELLRQASDRIATLGLGCAPGELENCVNQLGELRQACPTRPVLARFAGDEFVIVLPQQDGAQEVQDTADRILAALRQPFQIAGSEVAISASIGVARFPLDTANADELLSFADIAMYDAKQSGKDRCRFFDVSLWDALVERTRLENDLRGAVERDELVLHFQPKLSARTMGLRGVEALARWRHPDLGDIPPDTFVKIAEQAGFGIALDSSILRLAVQRIRAWMDQGVKRRIAVNISAPQFMRPEFVGEVLSLLDAHGVDPELLELEVTERIVMADFAEARRRMDDLQAAGVRISIDDFGTGYSNLSQLSQLSFDMLKIDKSLVDGIGASAKSEAILTAVIQMAHALGHTVVAEGVELAEQHAFLQQLGCDEVQGYLFSRPLPEADLEAWEAQRGRVGAVGLLEGLSARLSLVAQAG